MKKIVFGIIIGVGLTLGTSIFADNIQSLIGMKVDATFPVTIEGKKVSEDAVLINGHTYLQVRAMGDALNYDISFDADLGVKLNKKAGASTVTNNTYSVTQETVGQIQARHDAQEVIDTSVRNKDLKNKDLQGKIKLNQDTIDQTNYIINKRTETNIAQTPSEIKQFEDGIQVLKDTIKKLQDENKSMQSEIDALNGVTPSPTPTTTP